MSETQRETSKGSTAREKYQNLSEEEKDKRWKKPRERHKNLIEEEKEKKL